MASGRLPLPVDSLGFRFCIKSSKTNRERAGQGGVGAEEVFSKKNVLAPERHDGNASDSCANVGIYQWRAAHQCPKARGCCVSRVFSGSGRRATRCRACSAASTSAGG